MTYEAIITCLDKQTAERYAMRVENELGCLCVVRDARYTYIMSQTQCDVCDGRGIINNHPADQVCVACNGFGEIRKIGDDEIVYNPR